ncbi:1984_t:CDS:2 [Cetraspora pellucida]|uniref:1984_t:CDS:1 n=1 Tax=Cetraspora pellucida TaxID=1433469 RepID=A0ACA9JZ00_9GLOM|nr:1984_t:CDS:2 [Cetraspora pellucida]
MWVNPIPAKACISSGETCKHSLKKIIKLVLRRVESDQTSNPKKQEALQQEYVTYVSTTSSNEKESTGELTTMMLRH